MKAYLNLFLMMTSITVVSQENPWTPQGENPWAAYEGKNGNQTANQQEAVKIDSTLIKTTSEQKMSEDQYSRLLDELEDDVTAKYKNKKDFGVGFGIGIIMGITGVIGDGIYAGTNSKREKKVVEEIKIDSTYQAVPEKTLTKETKKTMKNKKFGKALGGTLVAVLVRAGIFTMIIMS